MGTEVKSLNAGTYTLSIIGTGSVSCVQGTATQAAPLTFTLSVSTIVLFTTSGSVTKWMLSPTSYPVPYVPPGVTQSASNATTSGGVWFTNTDGSELWKALTGSPFTLATRILMGVGSADVPLNAILHIIGSQAHASNSEHQCYDNGAGIKRVAAAKDGVTTAYSPGDTWPRNAVIQRFTQVNTAGTRFRVGYMIEGTNTTIQWSHPSENSTTWAVFDGSFNPSTLYRLMIGYSNPYPMGTNKIAVWKRQVSDAELLEVFS